MPETLRQRVLERFEHTEQQLQELNVEIEEAVEAGIFPADLLEQTTQLLDLYQELEEVIYGSD